MNTSKKAKLVTNPKVWGILYIVLIFVFAFIYASMDSTNLRGIPANNSTIKISYSEKLGTSLYFSTVTITTLGYGDISPKDTIGKIACGAQSLLGIIVIGFFLNALASRIGELLTEEKDKEVKKILHKKAKNNLVDHFKYEIEDQIHNLLYIIHPMIFNGEVNYHTNNEIILQNFKKALDQKIQFSKMKSIFATSNTINDPKYELLIDKYYKQLDLYTKSIQDFSNNIDTEYFPDLKKRLFSHKTNIRIFEASGFLSHPKDINYTSRINQLKEKLDTIKDTDENNIEGDIMKPLIYLRKQLEELQVFFKYIIDYIEQLEKTL